MRNKNKSKNLVDEDLINIPFRDEKVYLDIGGSKAYRDKKEVNGFNSYELTTCIIYELATRNDKVIQIFKEIEKAPLFSNKKHQDYYNKMKEGKIENEHNYLPSLIPHNENTENLKQKLMEEYFIYPNNYHSEFKGIASNNLRNALTLEKILDKKLANYKTKFKKYEGYTVSQGSKKDDINFDVNIITQNFQREINDVNLTFAAFNINMPREELLAYIAKIKDDYDNSKGTTINSSYEMIEKELNLEMKDFKNMNAEEWADAFYIYDCHKMNNNSLKPDSPETLVQKIREQLTKYHGVDVSDIDEKDINDIKKPKYRNISYDAYLELKDNYKNKKVRLAYSDRTIEDRQKIMYELIDNEKYKTLILLNRTIKKTGKK